MSHRLTVSVVVEAGDHVHLMLSGDLGKTFRGGPGYTGLHVGELIVLRQAYEIEALGQNAYVDAASAPRLQQLARVVNVVRGWRGWLMAPGRRCHFDLSWHAVSSFLTSFGR